MSVKNGLKRAALQCVQEMGEATSRGVADRLGYNHVSGRKKVSLTLLKCKRQGLMDRAPRKHGKVWEYVYVINDRGRKRLYYWRVNGEVEFGAVNVDEIVDEGIRRLTPLLVNASISVSNAESLCQKTGERNVFSIADQLATFSSYPFTITIELASAFAAQKLLETISPKTWATIRNAAKKSLDTDMFVIKAMCNAVSSLIRLNELTPPLQDNTTLVLLLVRRRLNELNMDQWALYCMLQDAEKRAETYKSLYEFEREWRKELERQVLGQWACYNKMLRIGEMKSETGKRLFKSERERCAELERQVLPWPHFDELMRTIQSLWEIYRSTVQLIIETDQQIIKFLSHRARTNNFDLVFWLTHFLKASIEENARLQSENEALEGRIQQTPASINKPLFSVDRPIQGRTLETAVQPMTKQSKPSTPVSIDSRRTEHKERGHEPEEDWEDFNTLWWRHLTIQA